MSNFAIFITVGIVLFVLGIVFLIFGICKCRNNSLLESSFLKIANICFSWAIVIIISAFVIAKPSDQRIREQQETYKNAMSAYSKGADMCIDGEPVSDNFDISLEPIFRCAECRTSHIIKCFARPGTRTGSVTEQSICCKVRAVKVD